MEPIAIIGIGCRFPGAKDKDAFWQMLRDGVDAIAQTPKERSSLLAAYDPDPKAPGKTNNLWGGFLKDIDQFDPHFFSISRREAAAIDPQQRLLQEVAWESLEDAGILPESLAGSRTGVFIGLMWNDYAQMQMKNPSTIDAYTGSGSGNFMTANRLSYRFNFHGPSMVVDTGCSSSLTAVHLACQSLWQGDSTLALAGGVNLILEPGASVFYSKAGLLAANGRCKTFDAQADGIVRGEGVGLVVLKRLSRALSDGDPIYAVIRGSATNHDGLTNGVTAPSQWAQESLLREAYAQAGVSPSQIQYVEAHGTGTLLGDPIEAKALGSVLSTGRSLGEPCAIGSVKSNIGHLEAAAGIAALIKVALALKHKEIPPSLHFQQPNPHIPFVTLPLRVQQTLSPWPKRSGSALAGVSSFGLGGSNVHMVMEEAPQYPKPGNDVERSLHLLTLSAKTENALQDLARHYEALLAKTDVSLADICFSANTGRSHFPHRLAIAAASTETLCQQLGGFATGKQLAELATGQVRNRKKPKIAFIFTGQGSQYVDMGRELYATQPSFRQALDHCDQLLRPYLEQPLLSVLYPDGVNSPLNETAYTQPALFALEYALAKLWQSWGIEPDAVMGHSVGEYAAACVAGVFSLEDAIKLIANRGQLMQSLPRDGEMVVVFATEARVSQAIAPYQDVVGIAAINGLENIVISGARQAIQAVVQQLTAEGVKTTKLNVSHAFHSPLMEPILADFQQIAAKVNYSEPQVQLVSNLTGQLTTDEVMSASYWTHHIREAVRFADGVKTLHQEGYELFLEIGSTPILSGMGQRCLPENAATWLHSLKKGQADWAQLLDSLKTLYVRGFEVNWIGFDQDYVRQKVSLPTYPFQRESFWIQASDMQLNSHHPATEQNLPQLSSPVVSPSQNLTNTLYKQTIDPLVQEWFYGWQWQPESLIVSPEMPAGAVVIFKDSDNLAENLGKLFDNKKYAVYFVTAGEKFIQDNARNFTINPSHPQDYEQLMQVIKADGWKVSATIYLWNYTQALGSTIISSGNYNQLEENIYNILLLGQALIKYYPDIPINFLVLTQGAYITSANEQISGLHQVMGATIAQTITQENENIQTKIVDVIPQSISSETLAQILFQELAAKPAQDGIVAIRQGQRLRRTLEKIKVTPNAGSPKTHTARETWLITGGTSDVGAEIAKGLVSQVPVNLVLTGRSTLPPQDTWDALQTDKTNSKRIQVIRDLEQLGATVMYQAVDVTNAAQMQQLIVNIHDCFGHLDGVIHAAGVQHNTTFKVINKTPKTVAPVLAPKVQGTIILDQVTQNEPLKSFVVISSAAASHPQWGANLGDYAAANAFLDNYVIYRTQRGGAGRSLAVNFSLWRDKGMAKIGGFALTFIAKAKGLNLLAPPQAVNAFLQALSSNESAVIHIIDLIEPKFIQPEQPQLPITPPSLPKTQNMRQLVRGILAQYLSIPEAQLEGSKNFQELDLDSIGMIEAIKQLSQTLNQELFPTLLFEYQTPDDLADFLESQGYTAPNISKNAETTKVPTINNNQPENLKNVNIQAQEIREQDIAIIGMACKVPGADNLEQYWDLLMAGKSVIRDVPAERWSTEDYFEKDGTAAHTTYCKRGGFLERPYDFDALFFGISPREATAMDPQQRLFLEVAWQALQMAGYGGRYRTQDIGVFVGCGQNNYVEHFINYQQYAVLRKRLETSSWFSSLSPQDQQNLLGTLTNVLKPSEILPESAAGNELNGIAARVSHCLDFNGPSLSVNTACSSSLVALNIACESLRAGQTRMAIVGGVNLNLSPSPYTFLSKVKALSPDGKCYPFDRRAGGMVLGEGAGVVILKPLKDAIADGDYIHAVIKGVAVNNDGHSQGITAPNPKGQAEAIRKAYRNAGIDPQTVSYIETHGTGTLLGDPVEVEGMTQAFRSFTSDRSFCAIGSVKSSIGHMLSASGIVSLIKVVLAMQHGNIPGTVGFQDPNPHINFAETPFYPIGEQGMNWSVKTSPRRAGINGFGFGGTNCHVILEESPVLSQRPANANQSAPNLLLLTARNQKILKQVATQLLDHLVKYPEQQAAQVCFTMNNTQREQAYKAAMVVSNRQHLLETLKAICLEQPHSDIYAGRANPQRVARVHVVMDDSIALAPEEVETLGQRFPHFQQAYTQCENLWTQASNRRNALTNKAHTFAVQYALGRLLMSLELQPNSLLVQGTGVLVGACLTGKIPLEQAMSLLVQIEAGTIIHPVNEQHTEAIAPTWTCPLVTVGGIFRNSVTISHPQLAKLVQTSSQLNLASCQEVVSEEAVYLDLGNAQFLKKQLVDNPQLWFCADNQQPSVKRWLVTLAKLYIAGVRFNTKPLFSSDVSRVPLPTYPFEHKTYKVSVTDSSNEDNFPQLPPVINKNPQKQTTSLTPECTVSLAVNPKPHQISQSEVISITLTGLMPIEKLSPLLAEQRQSSYLALDREFKKLGNPQYSLVKEIYLLRQAGGAGEAEEAGGKKKA
ncbi:MAG: SDR family oxidoreductase [Nostoc desertorum CM1-VF14]|jgi:acyl transferase domain-containing protein/acyl carrier protein|nr:SDR family oxidoreductase [Nostoc desertorum CM1-VF14]